MSLTQTLSINSVHLVFAGVINLICLSWLVDMLHFLPCYFSFLDCSETMPVSSVEPAATYTQFTKWFSRATLTRRSRLHQELCNAETLVLLMSDVKASTSLCSLQYARWTTELKRSDQRTLSRTRTDITRRKVQNEVIEMQRLTSSITVKEKGRGKGEGERGGKGGE